MKRLVLAALTLGLLATPALADERAREVETFLREYIRLWNAGDSEAITSRIYRFEGPNPWSEKAGLQAEFDRLKKDGYARSDLTALEGCMLSRDRAVVEMRYIRVKTDGTPMAPKDRLTLYFARKFPDGWRVTQYMAASPTMKLNCQSAE